MVSVIEMKKEIGKRIKEFRKLAKLSQVELAEKLSVTNRAVSNWESGANGVDVELIPAICEALHISPNDLMDTPSVQTLSPEALEFARRFDKLDAHGKRVISAIMDIESEECVTVRLPIVGTAVMDGSVETRHAARKEVQEIKERLEKEKVEA